MTVTGYELSKALNRFSEISTKGSYLAGAILGLAEFWRKISNLALPRLATGNQHELASINEGVRNELAQAVEYIRSLSPSLMFPESLTFRVLVGEVLRAIGPNAGLGLARVPPLLQTFEKSYEVAIKSYSLPDAVKLIVCAAELQGIFTATNEFAHVLSKTVTLTETPPHGYGDLIIYLRSADDVDGIARKLEAIANLYSIACHLLDVSGTENRLRIVHFEVGTLFFHGRGAKAAIELVGDLVKSALRYCHRQYTNEGRIESIPRKVDAIDSILNLRDKLSKRGIDTQKLDLGLGESSIKIVDELNSLLTAELYAEIQGETFDLPASVREKLSAPVELKMLEGPEPPDDVDEPESDK